jgi:O-antigen/teichoic acid export membrane protein
MPVILRKVPLGERLWAGWKKLVSDTLAFNFYPLIVNLYDRIDVILLSRLAGNFAVGIYALPYRGFAMLQMIPYGLMGALLPSLSKSDWDAHARERSAQIMKFLYLAALFSIQATTLLGHTVIGFAFGEAYQASARVLEILIWATIPMFLNFGLNTFLLARNREKVFLRTASVCLFVNIAANAILIPRYSYVAAASVTILTEIALLIQNVLLMREHFGFVPLPEKLWRVNIGFLLTLGVGLTALPHLPAVAVTFATLSLFAIYLYVSKSAPNVSQWARSPLGSPRVSLENQ